MRTQCRYPSLRIAVARFAVAPVSSPADFDAGTAPLQHPCHDARHLSSGSLQVFLLAPSDDLAPSDSSGCNPAMALRLISTRTCGAIWSWTTLSRNSTMVP